MRRSRGSRIATASFSQSNLNAGRLVPLNFKEWFELLGWRSALVIYDGSTMSLTDEVPRRRHGKAR
jgi:hypothetical protein